MGENESLEIELRRETLNIGEMGRKIERQEKSVK